MLQMLPRAHKSYQHEDNVILKKLLIKNNWPIPDPGLYLT